jgi:hypothetical protein
MAHDCIVLFRGFWLFDLSIIIKCSCSRCYSLYPTTWLGQADHNILTSLEAFSVLTCGARVHLGAFDGHYYIEDHKFKNQLRSLTFVSTNFVKTDWHVSQDRFPNHNTDNDRSGFCSWGQSQLLANSRWGNDCLQPPTPFNYRKANVLGQCDWKSILVYWLASFCEIRTFRANTLQWDSSVFFWSLRFPDLLPLGLIWSLSNGVRICECAILFRP